jgi:hypothetical protein
LDRVRQSPGLITIGQGRGLQRFDRAEPAAPRAALPRDHERRRAASPAIMNVRAPGLFAHGVKVIAFDGVLRDVEYLVRTAGGEIDAQPFGQTFSIERRNRLSFCIGMAQPVNPSNNGVDR